MSDASGQIFYTMALRWGIAGCGMISGDFCLAIRTLPADENIIVAVAARKQESAVEFAKRHGAKRAYDSYASLAKDPEIDVVYIGVIHPRHAELSTLMLSSGKHVVCETPMTMSAADTRRVIETAKKSGKLFVEGFWSRFFPVYHKLREELASKSIGDVLSVSIQFGIKFSVAEDSRFVNKEMGGGMTLDLGVYAVQFANLVFNAEKPEIIVVTGFQYPTGVDKKYSATLLYSGDRMAEFLIAGDTKLSNTAYVCGTEGIIEIPQFWCPVEIKTSKGSFNFPTPESPEQTHYINSSGFVYEISAVRNAIKSGLTEVEEMKHSESIQLAEITDEILKQLGVSYS